MAGRIGTFLAAESFIYGDENPYISADLNEYTPAEYAPTIYDPRDMFLRGGYSAYKIAPSNRWPIVGKEQGNFGRDYYYRVHVSPLVLDLQTVASSQTREFNVWNAWPDRAANLDDILVSNPVFAVGLGLANGRVVANARIQRLERMARPCGES
ncbi:hypothetical protein PSV3_00306 [Septimatrevirus PSV34]|uniref:Uncharacterized protein n=1 Tax=Pseudomonas phage PSV3 TaxID=3003632 RepID=A0AAE9VWH3_9CAUD|nr:tail assembly protein [Pseudomonas phage PSV3]WBF77007.1 hypothetical protein PSV3_00306 [Pseudomonas phage PSV3]